MALNILHGNRQECGIRLSGVTYEANDALYPRQTDRLDVISLMCSI